MHSDADAGLPYVAEADLAVRLPGDAPADTYLRADLLVEAARRSGADAIHPGYGFLSENAEFARAVSTPVWWVGPAPESIEAMGSKVEAKKLMAAAGVPVLAPDEPSEADLPLLVKASAGGGGRGMRIVRDPRPNSPPRSRRPSAEAASAFGDGTVFVEPYVEHGRHVEVQVVGTADGVLVLGERDCSIQRRHQKVVEEAPARACPTTYAAPCTSGPRGRRGHRLSRRWHGRVPGRRGRPLAFWFLEMNTRLQVEHPVTELVHGVDLVELQIPVAEGRVLRCRRDHRQRPAGHAIEVRLYAEDPAADWQPQSGVLTFDVPA